MQACRYVSAVKLQEGRRGGGQVELCLFLWLLMIDEPKRREG
jgi:hypothetical protein